MGRIGYKTRILKVSREEIAGALDRVQKIFIGMLPGVQVISYEIVEKPRLFSLERRRLRGDLMEV